MFVMSAGTKSVSRDIWFSFIFRLLLTSKPFFMDDRTRLNPQGSPIIPATLENLQNFSGFKTFFEAYQWLFFNSKLEAEYIQFHTPHAQPSKGIISVRDIKAGAMDEVFKLLPEPIDIERVVCALNWSGDFYSDEYCDFLKKIPVRL